MPHRQLETPTTTQFTIIWQTLIAAVPNSDSRPNAHQNAVGIRLSCSRICIKSVIKRVKGGAAIVRA
jgi:hypothetical protein